MIRALVILAVSLAAGWFAAAWSAPAVPEAPRASVTKRGDGDEIRSLFPAQVLRPDSASLSQLAAALESAPDEAIRRLRTQLRQAPDGPAKSLALAAVALRGIHDDDAWDPFSDHAAAADVSWYLARLMIARLRHDDAAAKAVINAMPPALRKAGGSAFAEKDPAGMLEKIAAGGPLRKYAYSSPMDSIFAALGRLDANAATSFALTLQDEWQDSALSGCIGILALSDPAAAVRILTGLPREYGRMPHLSSLLRAAASAGPDVYANVVAAIPDDCGFDVRQMADSEMDGSGTSVSTAFAFASGKPDHAAIHQDLPSWIDDDAASAVEAVLQLPAGAARRMAVESAVEHLSLYDPAAALTLAEQSGESGGIKSTGSAWIRWLRDDPAAAAYWLSESPTARQSAVAAAIAVVTGYSVSDSELRGFPDALIPIGADGDLPPISDGELSSVWNAVRNLPRTAGRNALAEVIAERDFGVLTESYPLRTGDDVIRWLLARSPDKDLFLHRFDRMAAESSPNSFAAFIESGSGLETYTELDPNRAGARVFRKLCAAGHVYAAGLLLGRVTDPDSYSEAADVVLPELLLASPDAFRAIIEKAPLTAADRERWLLHPLLLAPRQQR